MFCIGTEPLGLLSSHSNRIMVFWHYQPHPWFHWAKPQNLLAVCSWCWNGCINGTFSFSFIVDNLNFLHYFCYVISLELNLFVTDWTVLWQQFAGPVQLNCIWSKLISETSNLRETGFVSPAKLLLHQTSTPLTHQVLLLETNLALIMFFQVSRKTTQMVP